jgi:hypothetical protein
MSSDLLKKILQDSESHTLKFRKAAEPVKPKWKPGVSRKSKNIKKEKPNPQSNSAKISKILGDRFKNTIKKMKVAGDKNIILEKNLKYLDRMRAKSKLADSVASHLLEKLGK